MRISMKLVLPVALIFALSLGFGCADDNGDTEADKIGVGAECTQTADCKDGQECLTNFKGGYCGLKDCQADDDCPQGSLCVAHDDGTNYCFRSCVEKVDCNRNRTVENEANCVGSITFVNTDNKGKACEPPSGTGG